MKTLKVSKPRRRVPRQSSGLFDELVMDYFAGGGGASLGIERALGRAVDVAINHDADAINMHSNNHPHTLHYCEDVWKVNPKKASGGRRVGMAWFSPDCRHFSRAKGSKPVKKNIRGLAWVVVRTAKAVKPRVIFLENVREFEDWGPLVHLQGTPPTATELLTCTLPPKDRAKFKLGFKYTNAGEPVFVPDGGRKGETFKRFVRELRNVGYHVEWRVLNAADYGAPTHRRRLFLIGRRDGRPVVWPAPTHGPKGHLPYRTAAECIDWSLVCPSIFTRKRPLAEKTMRRIAMGLKRYVLDNPRPFIVKINHGGDHFRGQPGEKPLSTVTGSHGHALVTPIISQYFGDCPGSRAKSPESPLPTITAWDHNALVSATLVQSGYGERPATYIHRCGMVNVTSTSARKCRKCGKKPYLRPAQAPRTLDINTPIGTVVGTQKHAVVAATLIGAGGPSNSAKPVPVDQPAGTIMGENHRALVTAILAETGNQNGNGKYTRPVTEPNATQTSKAKDLLIQAWCVKHFGGVVGRPISEPLPTTTARGTQNQLATAHLVHLNHGEKQWSAVDEPARTIPASGNHAALVYSFFVKYFGTAVGAPVDAPAHTVTGKDRFGLVTVEVNGEPYVIADIGMRMLTPRELARAQGFPDDYRLTGSKSHQVARIGNSVCPVMAEVLVRANVVEG